MTKGRVEMAAREVKRQCRTLRISAEQNTSVRIADDSPLLSCLPRFRGAGDVPLEFENRGDEQVAVRHADASGGDIIENQHVEDKMRHIHIGKRGSEAAGEEQPGKLRKTVRFKQEASSASASSDPIVVLEYLASGETQNRPGSVLVQKSGHV